MAYAVVQKNGSIKQREQFDMLEHGSVSNFQSKSMADERCGTSRISYRGWYVNQRW
jgi:hypothetical protein